MMKLNMIGGFSKEFVDYYCLMEDAKLCTFLMSIWINMLLS